MRMYIYAKLRHTTSGGKLEDTIPSVLKNNAGLNYYTCQSNFCHVKNDYIQKQEVVAP
jgi:hypothetical protein